MKASTFFRDTSRITSKGFEALVTNDLQMQTTIVCQWRAGPLLWNEVLARVLWGLFTPFLPRINSFVSAANIC